jgi:hypothetical protein
MEKQVGQRIEFWHRLYDRTWGITWRNEIGTDRIIADYNRVHFWPFDGWNVPPNYSVVAAVYPALWSRTFPSIGRTTDQQGAFATAEWLRRAGANGSLVQFLMPELEPHERKVAEIEGWILGVA